MTQKKPKIVQFFGFCFVFTEKIVSIFIVFDLKIFQRNCSDFCGVLTLMDFYHENNNLKKLIDFENGNYLQFVLHKGKTSLKFI